MGKMISFFRGLLEKSSLQIFHSKSRAEVFLIFLSSTLAEGLSATTVLLIVWTFFIKLKPVGENQPRTFPNWTMVLY